jgi:hypothetical protein
MSNRTVPIHVNELLIDAHNVSQMLNDACRKHRQAMLVTGCLAKDDTLLVCLEPVETPTRFEYVFAPFPDESQDGIIAEITNRYAYGFSTITGFRAGPQMWGLFAFDPTFRSPTRYS